MKKFESQPFSDKLRDCLENLTGPIPLPKTSKPMRYEYKYLLNQYDYARCKAICERYMAYDEYCKSSDGYYIGSLYFDSINDSDYYDKELGSYDRKKMRIRCYGYDSDWAHFEMKRKIDIYEYKDKVRLTKPQVIKITAGDFSPLMDIGTEMAMKYYAILSEGLYRPSRMIEYERVAFVLPFEDVRITFDRNVRYSASDFDMFKPKVMTPLFYDDFVIFEIKYNERLPGWAKKMLSSVNKSTESVSKYCFSKERMLWL